VTVIAKEIQIDVGHRVPDHDSKCRNVHGHRYRIVLAVEGEPVDERGNPEDGMVIDFARLGDALREIIHEPCDHGFIVAMYDCELVEALAQLRTKTVVVLFPPTAERLAQWWGEDLKVLLWTWGIVLHSLTVWETPTSCATWTPPPSS
jgi:6-pyruvoyltetrahydropterin/6-carboxytetrahydropterin synthase